MPHGFGHWLDDSYHGELLSGLWENGKPVGPFRSREFGSGFAFQNIRIGFVTCSDDRFESSSFFPSQTLPSRIGVAAIECSVSGGFFSHLPSSTNLLSSIMKTEAIETKCMSVSEVCAFRMYLFL